MILLKFKGLNKYTKFDLITEKSFVININQLENLIVKEFKFSPKEYREIKFEIDFSKSRSVLIDQENKIWETCKLSYNDNPNNFISSILDIKDSQELDPDYLFNSRDFSELFNNKHSHSNF